MRQVAAVLLAPLVLTWFPATGETLAPASALHSVAVGRSPEAVVDWQMSRVEQLLADDLPSVLVLGGRTAPVGVAVVESPAAVSRRRSEFLAATVARVPVAVEASIGRDRSDRRLMQQGLRNEGFDPGTPDGVFVPRTRAAIREWQQSRGASPTGYLNGAETELRRAAAVRSPTAPGVVSPPPPAFAVNASVDSAPARVATEVDPQAATAGNAEQRPRAMAGSGIAQLLPPEILLDRHLVRAERLLAEDDPGAALEEMNEILALQDEHGLVLEDDFSFRYARIAFAAGRTEMAIASLNEYLVIAGRAGEFYREALELLDTAEVVLGREEEERRTAELERRRAARWPAGTVLRDCETCPVMVVLPDSALAMGRHEVTVGEYRAFASATGAAAPATCIAFGPDDRHSWRDPGFSQTDRHPVTCMTWNDAQAYVSWLSQTTGATYRLPTETEWERAATGSQPGCYLDRRERRFGTCPVGTYETNAAGLSDMVGNVEEWMSDCVEGECPRRRVLRGGSFWGQPDDLRLTLRSSDPPTLRSVFVGFRVARTLDSE